MPTMKTVNCSVCGNEFDIELKRYNERIKRGISFYCSEECRAHNKSILCECANCGKPIWRRPSQLKRSKTGNVYCSKSCAVAINNSLLKTGENHPSYKGNNYRNIAFSLYPHECIVCGYDEDERILEVHHIDENRENNQPDNLCILCPNCHRKITLHYYILTEEFSLVEIQDIEDEV